MGYVVAQKVKVRRFHGIGFFGGKVYFSLFTFPLPTKLPTPKSTICHPLSLFAPDVSLFYFAPVFHKKFILKDHERDKV